MKDQGIIIQARSGSTRLPNKVLLNFDNNLTLIDILIGNLKRTFPDKKIILATTTAKQDDALAMKGQDLGVLVYRGSEDNVISRFVDCAKEHNISDIIRICSDNPFLNMEGIKEIINQDFEGFDYLSYQMPDGRPTIKSHLGLYVERMTTKALESVMDRTKDPLYLEHVTNYLYSNPELYRCHWLKLPIDDDELDSYRFTLDDEIDFKLHQYIYNSLQHDAQDINKLLSFVKENGVLETMVPQIKKYNK